MPRLLFAFPGPLSDVDPSYAARDPAYEGEWRGVIDALDHGRAGEPRRTVVHARSRPHAAQCARRITALAEARGFLALPATGLTAWHDAHQDAWRERTLLLIAQADVSLVTAVQALVTAS